MDFAAKAQYLALDVISDLGVSTPFGFLKHDKDINGYFALQEKYIPVLLGLMTVPWSFSILHSWPFKYLLPRVGDKVGFGFLLG